MRKPKKVAKAKQHPDQPKPFSGIRTVVFKAFAKIGSPIDKSAVLSISRGSAGIRIEVIKTISFLTHKQMLRLIGSIQFQTVRLTRFRIGALNFKGRPSLKFTFYVQGAKSAVTANLNTDIQVAATFMQDIQEKRLDSKQVSVTQHTLNSFFELVAQFNANNGFRVVGATLDLKALESKYRLSQFSFTFANRDGSLEVRRSVKAYTREHALDLLKKSKQIPKGFRVASASGKAQPKIEA